VTQSFFGDGLVYEDTRPLDWTEGPLTQGAELARQNAEDHHLLSAEASLEEMRVNEALKEESPALLAELQRLEYKLNLLLRMTASLAGQHDRMPVSRPMRMSARGMEWLAPDGPKVGSTGLLQLYINSAVPQPLLFSCRVVSERVEQTQRIPQLQFVGISDPVAVLLDKLIFRHHRRLIASAKHAPT
jgi:hypothetical protein